MSEVELHPLPTPHDGDPKCEELGEVQTVESRADEPEVVVRSRFRLIAIVTAIYVCHHTTATQPIH